MDNRVQTAISSHTLLCAILSWYIFFNWKQSGALPPPLALQSLRWI